MTKNDLIETLNKNKELYLVWSFDDAPKYLQDLSKNGGDEDWVIVMGRRMFERQFCHGTGVLHCYYDWIEQTDSMREPETYYDGDLVIVIGSHA